MKSVSPVRTAKGLRGSIQVGDQHGDAPVVCPGFPETRAGSVRSHGIAVAHRHVGNLAPPARRDKCAPVAAAVLVSGDEIGVQMRFHNVLDAQVVRASSR
jgi:hypothetical protein